jgi:hypothetical protein
MFQPHHQPDPRVPGMGLGFHLDDDVARHVEGNVVAPQG